MNNIVYLKKCDSYREIDIAPAVEAIINHFGGVEEILKRGKHILIKPNLLMARAPEQATTAHPEIVCEVARIFCNAGAEVVIADSPGGAYTQQNLKKVYEQCGMDRAAQRSGATLNTDLSSKKVTYDGIKTRSFELITPAFQANTIINIAKAKTHMLTYYTGAVKNLFGTIAGLNKAVCHAKMPDAADFCSYLVDLCRYNAPTINIIDGVEGMDGKGPSGGRVRQVGVIAAGENPFACDLAMMHIVGLDKNKSPIHKIAVKNGFVAESIEELILVGDHFPPIAESFLPAGQSSVAQGMIRFLPKPLGKLAERLFIKYPKVTRRCVGCADCARACPKAAITIVNRRAEIDTTKCIKCYCCHELCPIKAIDL